MTTPHNNNQRLISTKETKQPICLLFASSKNFFFLYILLDFASLMTTDYQSINDGIRNLRGLGGINAANGACEPRFAFRILPTVKRPWTSR